MELPGRGARYGEAPYDAIESLLPALAEELRLEFDAPFALFGHSMGARIAFELARYFRDTDWPKPSHVFVSGSCAPQRRPPQTALLIGRMPEALWPSGDLT
ncbi:MAG: alpha/beta fold hydrolase [Luteitalea sp.]|nr:alpha/beta fold hydrolase [Luteitalea sp.]